MPSLISLGQGHKDAKAEGQLYHVGAGFEAVFMGLLMAASDVSCNFFCILTSGFEQCVEVYIHMLAKTFLWNSIMLLYSGTSQNIEQNSTSTSFHTWL